MKPHVWLFALALAALPLGAHAAPAYDIQIPSGGITVQHTPVMLGESVKIYVTVDNIGNKDIEGTSIFEDGGANIGMKAFSAKATGKSEEIWQVWTPKTVGNHIIKIRLVPDESIFDATPANNQAQITVFVDKDTDHDGIGDSVDPDIDGDGVPNAQDQFPLDPSKSKDTDKDGIDDSKDSDIDNDGIYNWDEKKNGTDPTKYDTDGDGYSDKEDAYPLDPKRWKAEVPAPAPTAPPTPPAPNSTIADNGPDSNQTALTATPAAAAAQADPNIRGALITGTSSLQIIPTSTAEILVATSSQETATSTPAPMQENRQPDVSDKKSWLLSLALWGVAIVFGGLAGLFIWLAKKKETETEEKMKSK